MTRPAGTTARGLPYPGSAEIHPRTPDALKALAEAFESKITTIQPGLILDLWAGVLQCTRASTYCYFVVPFPKLASVIGWVGTAGIDLGGNLVDGWLYTSDGSGYGAFTVAPLAHSGGVGPTPPNAITVHALGWGTPK